MKKVASPSCPYCPSDSQNIHHLFISYPQASFFWNKFQSWFSAVVMRIYFSPNQRYYLALLVPVRTA